jgi:hypothetical protein
MKSLYNRFEYQNGFFYQIASTYWNVRLPPLPNKVGVRHHAFEFQSREIMQHIRASANGMKIKIREKLYEINYKNV